MLRKEGVDARFSNVLHHGGSGSDYLRVRVVGPVPADWEDSGRILPLGDTAADEADVTLKRGQELCIPPPPWRRRWR